MGVESTVKALPDDSVKKKPVNLRPEEGSRQPTGNSAIIQDAQAFPKALDAFYLKLLNETPGGNPEQNPQHFTDIEEGPYVALPYDPNFVEDPALWQACDPRNASFSVERDRLCQKYLVNLNNMRYLQAMSSKLLEARTIKLKIHYAHGNLKAIAKISQYNFVYEAVSESTAHAYDRVLNYFRIPITVLTPLPLDFMRAAASHSPLFSQWFHRHVVLYNFTREKFVSCEYYGYENITAREPQPMGAMVSVQVWMNDVHELLDTFLALPFRYDESFEKKYYVPGHPIFQDMKRARLRSIGELQDRFIFDFIIGNTDRGMEGHNCFVYGGCSANTKCSMMKTEDRIYGLAKYAYLDHGSTFHSHNEPEQNPFSGDASRIQICRFRKSTFKKLKRYESRKENPFPLLESVGKRIDTAVFRIIYDSVFRKTQTRLNKVVFIMENCLQKYPKEEVFSIPDYDEVRIAEEDITLSDD
ncbi:unnamed protein product [Phytomonas sp. EM1]|nr:unnamed protein product [Phytomonas sp. EM1]|eukprot:CCW59878.1 unnamed protein product [Phytomonas sp. isolate EM1]